jgi:L-lysine 2,3-aminomutase
MKVFDSPAPLILSTNRCAMSMYCRHCFRKRLPAAGGTSGKDSQQLMHGSGFMIDI